MPLWFEALSSYPTAIYSTLLLVVLIYWLAAIAGLVDFDHSQIDHDLDTHVDNDASDISLVASWVLAMGLNGVPFSMVVSLLVFFGWLISALAGQYLLAGVPTLPLRYLAGTVTLLVSFALSLVLTARVIRPLRGLFVTHHAVGNASLVGGTCRVLTLTVDEQFGQAEVLNGGTAINIRVSAPTPNSLGKGSTAHIISYEPATQRYEIAPADPPRF
jgi:hypothetical protein